MTPNLLSELEGVLQELISTLDNLVSCLKDEREAIVEFDLHKIKDAYKRKNELLLRIRYLEGTKSVLVASLSREMGYESSPTLQFLLEKLEDRAAVESIRHKSSCLKSLAQAAQEFNEDQRRYIAHSLSGVQSSMAILNGALGKPAAYGPEAAKNATKRGQSAMMDQNV